MAQFIPFEKGIQVNGQTVLSVVNALSAGQDSRSKILEKYGISNPQPEKWYSQEKWLEAFQEISDKVGQNTLFAIGKAIPENAKFPPEIDNLEKALSAIDMAYHMNHTKGDIGYYKLTSFNSATRIATMECKNPYPSEFDRGIITTMLRKFKPKDSLKNDVVLDLSKPSRLKGDDSCTYKITW
jgi:hypothetical protein